MERLKLLRLEKTPKKLSQIKTGKIELVKELGAENKDSLGLFLEMIEKMKRGELVIQSKERDAEDLVIGSPVSLNKKILLVQMSKEEIIKHEQKMKRGFNNILLGEENTIILDKENTDFTLGPKNSIFETQL